jgi:serine/threonine-protein kinase
MRALPILLMTLAADPSADPGADPGQARGGPERAAAFSSQPAPTGARAWRKRIGKAEGCVVGDGRVYLALRNTRIVALDAKTGERRWRMMLPGKSHGDVAPTFAGGRLFAATFDGPLLALDAKTGEELWRFDGGPITDAHRHSCPNLTNNKGSYAGLTSPALVSDGLVVFGLVGGLAVALDAKTGEERWRQTTCGALVAPPTRSRDAIVLSEAWGEVRAVRPNDGSVLWQTRIHGNHADSVVALPSGDVLLSENLGGVYRYSPASGRRLWGFDTDAPSRLAYDDGFVYLGSFNKEILALDVATGREAWRVTAGNLVQAGPLVVGDTVVVGASDKRVYIVDKTSGKVREKVKTRGAVWEDACADGERVYVLDDSGDVTALR